MSREWQLACERATGGGEGGEFMPKGPSRTLKDECWKTVFRGNKNWHLLLICFSSFVFSLLLRVAKMVRMNVLADCLKTLVNAEKRGRRQVLIRPSSKVIIKFLQCMQRRGYIGDFEIVDDHRAGKIVIELLGRINKCGVISPRFDIQVDKIEQFCSNLLPSRQFGHLVLTTAYGIMDHEEARRKHTGGKILGYFF
nr:TPA: 40S ribosomal protein S15a, putative [Toxoplasma gondii VEG]